MNVIKIDDIFVCIDCLHFIEIGDMTYFDGAYDPDQANQVILECETGMLRLAKIFGDDKKLLYIEEENLEFSMFPCQCCQTKLAGERFKFIVHE